MPVSIKECLIFAARPVAPRRVPIPSIAVGECPLLNHMLDMLRILLEFELVLNVLANVLGVVAVERKEKVGNYLGSVLVFLKQVIIQ